MSQYLGQLVKILKERENPKSFGLNSGIVISSEPELSIQIDNKHIFNADEILVLIEPMKDYERECEIELEGEIEQQYSENVEQPPEHTWTSSKSSFKFNGTGKIKWLDTLKEGDLVLCETIQNDELLVVYGRLKKIGG